MGIDLSKFEMGTYDDLRAGKIGKGDYGLAIYDESQNLKKSIICKGAGAGQSEVRS